MMRSTRWSAFWLTVWLITACGASKTDRTAELPIDFGFTQDKEMHQLSELRGRPLVLVLMRTSEIVSQIHVTKVAESFKLRAGELQFLVLTIEETEAPFVEAYVELEKLPFPIGVAEPDVLLGKTALGIIPNVPITYFIDSEGRVRTSTPGVIAVDDMNAEIERLLDF